MRNSSLVKCFCAENVTGLKHITEAMDPVYRMVEERSVRIEAWIVRTGGLYRSENAGISNERQARNLSAEYPRFPGEG